MSERDSFPIIANLCHSGCKCLDGHSKHSVLFVFDIDFIFRAQQRDNRAVPEEGDCSKVVNECRMYLSKKLARKVNNGMPESVLELV